MANISSYLQAILDAVYGEEVRGSIHDAIAAINTALEAAIGTQLLVTDTTFAVSGAGADSKTVGDKTLWLRGALTSNDDCNDIVTNGVWYFSELSTPPGHWPLEGTEGRLIVFGASSSTRHTKVQLAVSGSSMAYRYGSLAASYNAWQYVATEDTALCIRGALTSSDDCDDIVNNGFWYFSGLTTPPAHWPFDSSEGRLVVFASNTATHHTKVQLAFYGYRMAYRYGTSSASYSPWQQVATEDTALKLVSALTTSAAAEYQNKASRLPAPSLARIHFAPDHFTDCPSTWNAVCYVLTMGTTNTTQLMLFPASGNIYIRSFTAGEDAPTKFPKILDMDAFDGFLNQIDLVNEAYFRPASTPFDLLDMPKNSRYLGSPSNFDPGDDFPWTLDATRGYTVSCEGNGQNGTKIYRIFSASRRELFYGYKTATYQNIQWFNFSPSGANDMTNYVAIGASTTVGGTGTGQFTSRPYPSWVGDMGNFTVTNLARGGTDFVARGGSDNTLPNYMDVVTDPDNRELLEAADLITVWVGINDNGYGIVNGEADDYYAYQGTETFAELRRNATKAGAMNFVIKYVSEHFPRAQLMFVVGPRCPLFYPTATISNGKVVYTPSQNQYSQQAAALAKQVCAAANVPVADASDAFGTVWNVSQKFEAAANKHPTLQDYDQYDKAIAAAIVAKYRN